MKPVSLTAALVLTVLGLAPLPASVTPDGGMMRYPDVSATHIAFVYADDIWLVPREGGTASPLASPPGAEIFPRFSADGRTLAFSGNYDGNLDLYTVPVEGGIPQRVTYHGSSERLCDWTLDGHLVFAMNGLGGLSRQTQLFRVPATGGLPERLPVPYGGYGVISPDGQWLAYTPRNRDFRTWKRYRGGWASDIWLFDLDRHSSRQVTDWEGTDTLPMWQGRRLYYLSDAGPAHRLNLWCYDLERALRHQVTHFRDYDVKWPSQGPGPEGTGEIVFEYDARLYLLDLDTEMSRPVTITVPGARPTLRPIRRDVSGALAAWSPSPHAKRVVVSARGDLWTLPARYGSPRNLTHSSGVAEREPAWSPDGRWIAYFSDASGENNLVLRPATDDGEPQVVTQGGVGYGYQPVWSPDSKRLVFHDHEDRFWLYTLADRSLRSFDRVPISGWRSGSPRVFRWSADSHWLTYTRPSLDNMDVICLYDVTRDCVHEVTAGMFNDALPTFDRQGDFLYFVSQREVSDPVSSDLGLTFVYRDTAVLHAVALRPDVARPFPVKSDEEPAPEAETSTEPNEPNAPDEPNDSNEPNEPNEPAAIELAGFEERAFRLPVKRGRFAYLAVNDRNQLIYLRRGEEGARLQLFDPFAEEPEEKTVLDRVSWARLTPDGKRLLVRREGRTGFIDAQPGQKLEHAVVTSPMTVEIEPRAEWAQVFADAWRFMRDYFYDPHLHRVDWPAVRRRYEAMLADCVSRRDVSYVIREMISEINAGHTYYREGDVPRGPSRPVGYLGVDFDRDQGFYRFARILEGGRWDTDARSVFHGLSPEDRAACRYLFRVNGVPVDTTRAPWAAFVGLAGRTVTLTVGPEPDPEQTRDVVVTCLGSEAGLRYRAWVEANRRKVAELSDGRIGYLHVPDTGSRGQRELFRQFYGQMNRQALIVDERWNAGGNIADRFVELLNRPIYLRIFERYEHDWRVPTFSHQGPKCMLINGESGSGGDIFPYLFRKAGLGKLIGMRTWGGVIGIAKNPSFIDGSAITVPFITFYETDGTLTMEGNGVEPDIEVVDDPALMVDGTDPQLVAAVQHLLREIETHPYVPAPRPAYPDRSGMGIREEDK